MTPMRLPGAENAWIEPAKLRDYLLSPSHPVGRSKAAYFTRLGFRRDQWILFEQQLLRLAREGDAEAGRAHPYGRMYLVRGSLEGPAGRKASVVSVWIVRFDEDFPRLVTAIPGDEP